LDSISRGYILPYGKYKFHRLLYLGINKREGDLKKNWLAMIVTIVHVEVKKEHIEDFIRITSENHHQSVKEPENLRFDVLQKAHNPAQFALYEAYKDEKAVAAHKETPHYKKWRETVAPWMARPREGIRYNGLLPEL
jgi:autoinducer 2-degrading protein